MINVATLIIAIAVPLSIGISIYLSTIKNTNKRANSILAILLLLASGMLSVKALASYHVITNIWWLSFVDINIFLFGPLSFVYLKRLINFSEKPFSLAVSHYIPAITHLIFSLVLLQLSEESLINLNRSGQFTTVFFFIEVLAILYNIYYWSLCRKEISIYLEQEKKQLSFIQPIGHFLRVMFYMISALLLIWMVNMVSSSFFKYPIPFFSYNFIWIGISIIVYIIAGFALFQPTVFRIAPTLESKSSDKKRLSDFEIEQLEKKLNTLIVKEKIHLEQTLTLSSLASMLKASSNNVSWFLNNVYQTSFYDYINELRVREFIKKIENNEHKKQTLLALSMEVGFNSKSTFNKAFKTIVKVTPSNYIKRMSA
ncbi:AraC family transcriptional regulator [Spongiivirga sp. MCCC 1A20706]|uniref:helix-turn-helix domain-containing protein n=1 Tax=Spongiivirga sp. MCCC 1A20706 TaxID=3160963 RepID=UPI0039779E27